MKVLKKSFEKINSIKYETYERAMLVLFEASGVSQPSTMLSNIFVASFFKESKFNIHALGSSKKISTYKYMNSTTDKFLGYKSITNFLKFAPKVILLHLVNFKKYINPDKLFNLEIDGIYMGDAIRDEYLRYNQKGTIKEFNWKLFLKISEAFYYYSYFKNLYKKYDYEYVIINHHCYVRQLIMSRMAVRLKIKVIFNGGESVVVKKWYSENAISNEHISQPNNNIIKAVYSNHEIFENMSKDKDVTLERNSGINYYNNNINEDNFILDIKNKKKKQNKKLVVIYAHVYADNITGSDGRRFIFMDHYLWVKNTLKLCKKNKNIITILKPHPAEKNYFSDINSEMIYKEFQEKNDDSDLILCPDNIDFRKHSDMIDLVITSRGTIGVEMPCLGVPVLAQEYNHAVFSNNDLVIESKNYTAYANSIARAHLIEKLNEEEIKKAVVFAKLSNILVFYKMDDMMLSSQEILKESKKEISLFDKRNSINSLYVDNLDDVVVEKLVNFEKKYKKLFFADWQNFLNDDKMKYLAEVSFHDKMKIYENI